MLKTKTVSEPKVIADFEAQFETSRKSNLSFDIQDGTAYIYLVADGLQMAEVAKMLLLKGRGKTFGVKIYEIKATPKQHPKKTSPSKTPILK